MPLLEVEPIVNMVQVINVAFICKATMGGGI